MKCKILGCENECWNRGYSSSYNYYCKHHGVARERLDDHYTYVLKPMELKTEVEDGE